MKKRFVTSGPGVFVVFFFLITYPKCIYMEFLIKFETNQDGPLYIFRCNRLYFPKGIVFYSVEILLSPQTVQAMVK